METEIVNEKTGELVAAEPDKGLIFGTKDPDGIVEKATKIANKLVDIVEKAKLYSMIKDKKYVKAEGWTTMAAMLGVFPSVESCEKLDRANEVAYASKVVLRTISGVQVGSGEAICSSAERSWGGRDEYAVKSMSQTRALGKACRISFSWIMALAGFEPTPAEEMVNELPQRQVSMPRAKAEPARMDMHEKREPSVETSAVQAPVHDEPGDTRELDFGISQPPSKFFEKLHKTAREKGISSDKMKRSISVLYGKSSSKELTDTEAAQLIQLIEKDQIK